MLDRPRLAALAVPLLLAGQGACASPRDYPLDHTLALGAEGGLVRPRPGPLGGILPFESLTEQELEEHLDRMFDALQAGAPRSPEGRPRALLFLHGGLNTLAYASSRSAGQRDPILSSGQWPLFVQWNSSMFDCYGDHLLYVRQGEDWGLLGVPFAPLYLVGDLIRGIGELPKVVTSQTRGFVYGLPIAFGQEAETDATAALDPAWPAWNGIDVRIGEDLQGSRELAFDLFTRVLTYPLKLVEQPLIAGLGQPAWDQMQRRVYVMLHPDEDVPDALPRFLERLAELQRTEGLELTLVAHSMGAIIANEILRAAPELELERIVYLAAACSLSEYEEAVFPYLAAHPRTEMHHVTMHPKGEVREGQILDLTPRGSLLVWIDGFLARPLTPMDRTAGDFANLGPALARTPVELRERMHVKVFPTGKQAPEGTPLRHAQFAWLPWWEDAFLE